MKLKKTIRWAIIAILLVVLALWAIGKLSAPVPSSGLTDGSINKTQTQTEPLETYQPDREARVATLIEQKYQNQEEIEEFNFDEKTWWQYTIVDISISTDTSSTTLENYALKMAENLSPYTLLGRNPVVITQEAYDTGATSSIPEISDAVTLHQTVLDALLETSVPSQAADIHLRLVNNAELQTVLLANMAEVATEPLLAFQAAQVYQIVNLEFYKNLTDLNKFFQDRNIILPDDKKITVPVNVE